MNRKNFRATGERIKQTKKFLSQSKELDCDALLKELREEYRRDHPEKFKKREKQNTDKFKNKKKRYNNNYKKQNNKEGVKK